MSRNKYFGIIFIICMVLCGVAMPTIYAENNETNTNQDLNSIINRILELVNLERSKYNLNPLILDKDLNSAAKIRSEEIQWLFEHKRPDGSEITTISSKIQGENIASAQPTAEQVMLEWMNSPSHRKNILSSEFTTLGVGYNIVENDPNTKYGTHYWVQLFGGIKEPEPIKITMIQVGGLVVSSECFNKISLKWNSQNTANANGFQIFKYNSKTKSYSLKKTLNGNKNNKFTDTGLNSLSINKYKVRTYLKIRGETFYGPYSSIVTGITKPITPTMKLASKNKKVAVYWKKVSKATGYQIYKSKSKNGKYSLKKSISSKSKPILIENRVKKGNYYYKIRSYGVVENKKIYSEFSSPKGVKVK